MKSSLLLFIFLFAINCTVKSKSHGDGDSAKVIQSENLIATCYLHYDAKIFERLVANDFIYSENDQTYTRGEVMKQLSSATEKIEFAGNEDMKVYLHGNTAIVTGWLIIKGKDEKGVFERRYRYTDIWMKAKSDWQIIAAHDYIGVN